FYLDKQVFATLGMQNQDTNAYTYTVQEKEDNECPGGIATIFTLTLKENLKANNPDNNDDWHRWSVTATGSNDLAMQSATWRFRFFPEGTAIYSWCNSLETCTSGTLKQCLANGSNCYYNDKQQCLNNAELDCGPNPPMRTYFWCTGDSNCVQGALANCGESGKNCFLKQEQCQEQAQTECGGEALYFSCTTALTCNLTDLATCNANGGPCYRQDGVGGCPTSIKNQCQAQGGIFGGTFFNNLVDFPGNGFVLLQKLNLPTSALQNLQNWFAHIMPWLSLLLLLPCIIIAFIFPIAKGLIFNARTGEAIENVIVTIKNALGETIGQTLSDKFGRFTAMKLPKGQFQLVAQAPAYTFPSQTPDPKKQTGGAYYLGQTFTVKNGWNNLPSYQIPLDPTENTPMEKMTFSDWWRRTGLRFSNCVSFLWPVAFVLAVLITYFYPSVFNLIISGLFILSWLRKNMAQKAI
ncbi:MAG: carboxypeptidase-like regulatory domain-containing protein, partial [bacterium]|nr:carboxypeptidase-like regulatory domain-containing protein [bacterium]